VTCFDYEVMISPLFRWPNSLCHYNSQRFNELARYGITPEHLATAFKKWGVSWEAVGAYNAGFRKTERQNQRRLAYASDIYRIYTGIKSSKGIRLPAMEESFSKINGVQNN
ncbi:TPA: lytic transglycosylase, partial [Escherichia coli]